MRIRNHIRSNVIGYVALFVAMTGTAVALPGTNTVFTDDIVQGEVKSADLADDSVNGGKLRNNSTASRHVVNNSLESEDILDGAVGTADLADGSVDSAKVLDDTQAGGGLGPTDLAANSVGASEIASDAVNATEIANDTIDSGEIVDFGLSNQDIGVLFAEVNTDATLANSSGGVTSARIGAVGTGNYEVDFGRDVSNCTAVASLGNSTTSVAVGEVSAVDRSGNVEAVFVDTNTSAGAAADRAFRLVVVC